MSLNDHITIYGGSFNPPHIGHQIACSWLIQALNAKKVIVVPTYEHYFGKQLAHFGHRLEMCNRMVENFGDQVIVSDIERHLPKPNTTLNLIKYFKIWYPDSPIAVVVGSDLVSELHKWHHWDEVARASKVVVVGRSGMGDGTAESPFELYQYPINLSAVSSSDIRKRLSQDGDIMGLVPYSVLQYIEGNALYYEG